MRGPRRWISNGQQDAQPTLPVQEPVATSAADHIAGEIGYCQFHAVVPNGSNLYTTPQRPWVGLTFAEICECENTYYLHKFARAIEAKLKEKNT
jgi:hypothetical protein